MNLEEDLRFYWTMFTDQEVLSKIEEAVGQQLPTLGTVLPSKVIELAKSGVIRLRARYYEDSIFCIDAEKNWEAFFFYRPSSSFEKIRFFIDVDRDDKQALESFATEIDSGKGTFFDSRFGVLGFDSNGVLISNPDDWGEL